MGDSKRKKDENEKRVSDEGRESTLEGMQASFVLAIIIVTFMIYFIFEYSSYLGFPVKG